MRLPPLRGLMSLGVSAGVDYFVNNNVPYETWTKLWRECLVIDSVLARILYTRASFVDTLV